DRGALGRLEPHLRGAPLAQPAVELATLVDHHLVDGRLIVAAIALHRADPSAQVYPPVPTKIPPQPFRPAPGSGAAPRPQAMDKKGDAPEMRGVGQCSGGLGAQSAFCWAV